MAMAVPAAAPTLMLNRTRFSHSPLLDLFDRLLCLHDDLCMTLCVFSLMMKKPYLKSMYSSMYSGMKVKNVCRIVCYMK